MCPPFGRGETAFWSVEACHIGAGGGYLRAWSRANDLRGRAGTIMTPRIKAGKKKVCAGCVRKTAISIPRDHSIMPFLFPANLCKIFVYAAQFRKGQSIHALTLTSPPHFHSSLRAFAKIECAGKAGIKKHEAGSPPRNESSKRQERRETGVALNLRCGTSCYHGMRCLRLGHRDSHSWQRGSAEPPGTDWDGGGSYRITEEGGGA